MEMVKCEVSISKLLNSKPADLPTAFSNSGALQETFV